MKIAMKLSECKHTNLGYNMIMYLQKNLEG